MDNKEIKKAITEEWSKHLKEYIFDYKKQVEKHIEDTFGNYTNVETFDASNLENDIDSLVKILDDKRNEYIKVSPIIFGTGGAMTENKGMPGEPGMLFIKILSEDPLDDRLLLENTDVLKFMEISKIDGRPIFKVTDNEKFNKIKADLEKIGSIKYTPAIDTPAID